MATSDLAPPRGVQTSFESRLPAEMDSFSHLGVLKALASLRITVVLFALAILLVFFGTLAQVDNDVWEVVRHKYFRVWFAEIKFQTFERLVGIFYKPFTMGQLAEKYFPFPGGKLIGVALFVNLVAAHLARFKVVARGGRLAGGVLLVALGLVVTYFVVGSGGDQAIESELSPQFAYWMWLVIRAGLAAAAVGLGARLVFNYENMPRARRYVWCGAVALLGVFAAWLLFDPFEWFDLAGMRIMWQLLKGTNAALILLVGCILVFKQRAGIVLLHGGIGLMMLSEVFTATSAREMQMTIPEGGTVNWSQDIRTSELAIIDRSPKEADRVTVVPQSILAESIREQELVRHDLLPFKIRVKRWLPNSGLVAAKPGEENLATAGVGLSRVARLVRRSTGVDMESKVDLPSAYIELIEKESGKSLGTYLVSQGLEEQAVEVGGRRYALELRFEREYHPFTVMLKDFKFERYVGTNTAKSYESLVELKDPGKGVEREVRIWMNNPLRYAGMTFYQAGFDEATEQATNLQVVKNPNWMAPYVGCMFVLIGMVAHFGVMLWRFLERQLEELAGRQREEDSTWRTSATIVPLLVLVVFGGYLLSKTWMPREQAGEMRIHSFAALPTQYEGRVKPYDTVARNTLQVLSGKQELIRDDIEGGSRREPAIRWFLDVIAGIGAADDYRVFRIDDPEVLGTLGLAPRPGSWRYSIQDIRPKLTTLEREARGAEGVPAKEQKLAEKHMLALYRKLQMYAGLRQAFAPPQIQGENEEQLKASLQTVQADIRRLRAAKLPLAVPPATGDVHWKGLMEAGFEALLARQLERPVDDGTMQFYGMLRAYAEGDKGEFSRQLDLFRGTLAKYEQSLRAKEDALAQAGTKRAEILSQSRVAFEVFFNQFSPFYYCAALYLVAFVLGIGSWLGWTTTLRRSSIWLMWLTFLVHTFALWGRLYISGRPPVTNLYSSAVFIGWAVMPLALVLEQLFRLGLGNIVAAVLGFLTLVVAHFLSLDGDTMIVMQAVLDTQFWLATHVVCISLGYATTFLAGAFGGVYLLFVELFGTFDDRERKQLARIIYGVLCFAILFSFVGTVLGGLWADDSWGRFWGWDPKENGALIIVLYNALVLHARWGGMVKGRGLAALAVGGNIVTTWSWFGVNELNVGLHTYGASESNTALWLLGFAVLQVVIIVVGLLARGPVAKPPIAPAPGTV
ncbi:MAG: cytochrome c biogenesis protein CcsA [Pirellulales bacterium]|nr:cytochrome c biogenesis protein CcsA [Pirellulales bacterium]